MPWAAVSASSALVEVRQVEELPVLAGAAVAAGREGGRVARVVGQGGVGLLQEDAAVEELAAGVEAAAAALQRGCGRGQVA